MTPRLVYCSRQSSRMMGMDLPVKCWDPILFPCTFFPQNPRQGSNHFKGCSSSGYREVLGLCVHWLCSPINNTMSQPSLDTHRSSLLPQRKLQMPLPASGQVISIFLFFESDMLTSASNFCSLSSFLKLFPSGHSGLPNSLKFYLLHQIHPAGSCLILVPLLQISTPQQACTRGLATSYTLTCTHFFFF